MKGILLLNGEPPMSLNGASFDNNLIACCDGAYNWARTHSIIPDIVLGDMDSILFKLPRKLLLKKYSSEKDFSDGELGLEYLIEHGCTEIDIFGGGGYRDDHALMNYHLLYRALKNGVHAKMITNYSEFFLKDKSFILNNVKNRTISFVPFGGTAHILSLEGFKYPLYDTVLDFTSSITLSNVAIDDCVKVNLANGVLVAFIVNN